MTSGIFLLRTGLFAAAAALALAGCGRKADDAPVAQDEAPAAADESAAPEQVSDLTKVSSQGAAAEQARGVFLRAGDGDPEATFLARCQYCHVQLGPGTITLGKRLGPDNALLAERTDLTRDYVRTVVRHGLNTMPAISRVEVSDAELDRIADYLTRNNPQPE